MSLENLPEYDGGSVGVLVNRALREIYLDLDDRATLKKKRRVAIFIDLKPAEVDGKDLETAECVIAVKVTIPNKESRTNIVANDRKSGGLGFEPDTRVARHHPDQTAMDFDDDDSTDVQ